MEEELQKILNHVGKVIDGFEFYCSKDYKSDIKEYNGIKINYWNIIPDKTIYYCNSANFIFDNTKQ